MKINFPTGGFETKFLPCTQVTEGEGETFYVNNKKSNQNKMK